MIVHLHQLIVSITTTDLVAAEDGGRGEAGDGHAGLGGPELVVGVAAVLAEHGALGEVEGEGVAGPLTNHSSVLLLSDQSQLSIAAL